jgi:hypothetical protein
MRQFAPLSFALFFSLLAAACSSSPPDTMALTKGCMKTKCDVRTDADSRRCNDCMDACFGASYDCDASSACSASCSLTKCTDAESSTCEETGFKATLPKTKSDELDAACKKMVEHATTCGWSGVPQASDCDVFAVTELPERASAYSCLATTDCKSDPAACAIAPSTLGQTVCANADKVCGSTGSVCTAELSDYLDMEGSWLRSDVKEALTSCTRQSSCDDVKSCFHAWQSAVLR